MSHLPDDQTLPFTAEQRRYLSGPLVLHNPGWADSVPDWLIAAIPAARLEQVTAEVAGETERDWRPSKRCAPTCLPRRWLSRWTAIIPRSTLGYRPGVEPSGPRGFSRGGL